jgi:CheY-like chemotaxis protein
VKTILVVDDEVDMRDAVQAILEGEGYAVQSAANGRQALDLIENGHRPDLLLLDVMMPVLTGYEVLDRLAQKPELRSLPVVMMSAVEPPTRKGPAWKAFLLKPFTLEDLLQTVADAMPEGVAENR